MILRRRLFRQDVNNYPQFVKGPTFWINNVWLVATLCAKLAPQASFEPKNGFVQFIALLHTLFSVFRTSISLKYIYIYIYMSLESLRCKLSKDTNFVAFGFLDLASFELRKMVQNSKFCFKIPLQHFVISPLYWGIFVLQTCQIKVRHQTFSMTSSETICLGFQRFCDILLFFFFFFFFNP